MLWPESCKQGLTLHATETTATSCQQACAMDPMCSVWIFDPNDGCYRGRSSTCQREQGGTIQDAGRFTHGAVSILVQDLTQFRIPNLHNVGPRDAEQCRILCESDILCEYWQIYEQDCHISDLTLGMVPYPLTSANAPSGSVDAGEYLQHYCLAPSHHPVTTQAAHAAHQAATQAATQAPTAAPADDSGTSPFLALFFLLVLAGAAAAAYYYYCVHRKGRRLSDPTKPKTRGLVGSEEMLPLTQPLPQASHEELKAPQQIDGHNHTDPTIYYTVWQPEYGTGSRKVSGSAFPGDYPSAEETYCEHAIGAYPVMLIGHNFQEIRYYGNHDPETVDLFRQFWELQERRDDQAQPPPMVHEEVHPASDLPSVAAPPPLPDALHGLTPPGNLSFNAMAAPPLLAPPPQSHSFQGTLGPAPQLGLLEPPDAGLARPKLALPLGLQQAAEPTSLSSPFGTTSVVARPMAQTLPTTSGPMTFPTGANTFASPTPAVQSYPGSMRALGGGFSMVGGSIAAPSQPGAVQFR